MGLVMTPGVLGRTAFVALCARMQADRLNLFSRNLAYFRSWGYFFNTDAEQEARNYVGGNGSNCETKIQPCRPCFE